MKIIKTAKHNEDVIKFFGTMEDKKYLCVMDLELTCWADDDPDKRPRDEMEITEIGVVLLEAESLKQIHKISKIVRPRNYPKISKYNTELTTITQEEVDKAEDLTWTIISLLEYLPDPYEFVWVTWGGDAEWLNRELKAQGSDIEFDPRYVNLKVIDTQRRGKPRGLKKALKAYDIKQEQPAHRALADAMSTAKLAAKMSISALDASISNERTYRQALESNKKECLDKLLKKINIDPALAELLLKHTDWDLMKTCSLYKELSPYFKA